MAAFFKNLKRSFGKDNHAYQASLRYYSLYHHLPLVQQNSWKLFSDSTIFISFIVLGTITLFVYAFIQGLANIPEKKTSDYMIGMTVLPCFVVMLIATGFFLIRSKLKNRKRWKTFENAFIKCEGTVIGKWWESTTQVDNIGGIDYFVAIQYDGNRKVKAPISSGKFYKLKINDKVKLRYVSFQRDLCELIEY